jgi:hypothetical protein
MSLWYQSFMWDLEDAKTPEERIKVYKEYLRHPIGWRLVRQGQIPKILEAYRRELAATRTMVERSES